MADKIETWGNVVNYTILARKGRGTENKTVQKSKEQDLSIEEKYKVFSAKMNNKQGEG